MRTLSIVYTCALLIGMQACNSQTKKVITPKDSEKHLALNDSLSKPNFKVKVNKEFDSKGNLIRYDSTYTYTYKGKKEHGDNHHLNDLFETQTFDLFNSKINAFSNDSLLRNLFFDDDFFKRQSELNQRIFDGLVPKMDSLSNWNFNYHTFKPKSKTI